MLICCSHSWSASAVKPTLNTQHTNKTCWSVTATTAHQVRLPSGDPYRAHSWWILPHTAPHSIWSPERHTTQISCHFAAWPSQQLSRLVDPWSRQGLWYVLHWTILQWPSLPETGNKSHMLIRYYIILYYIILYYIILYYIILYYIILYYIILYYIILYYIIFDTKRMSHLQIMVSVLHGPDLGEAQSTVQLRDIDLGALHDKGCGASSSSARPWLGLVVQHVSIIWPLDPSVERPSIPSHNDSLPLLCNSQKWLLEPSWTLYRYCKYSSTRKQA